MMLAFRYRDFQLVRSKRGNKLFKTRCLLKDLLSPLSDPTRYQVFRFISSLLSKGRFKKELGRSRKMNRNMKLNPLS